MPIVHFVKEKKKIEVPEGANLRDVAMQAGINTNQGVNGIGASVNRYVNCGGFGMCGTCRVLITSGMEHTTPMSTREWINFRVPHNLPAAMSFIGKEDTMRLACMTTVKGDIDVETGPELNLFGENFFS